MLFQSEDQVRILFDSTNKTSFEENSLSQLMRHFLTLVMFILSDFVHIYFTINKWIDIYLQELARVMIDVQYSSIWQKHFAIPTSNIYNTLKKDAINAVLCNIHKFRCSKCYLHYTLMETNRVSPIPFTRWPHAIWLL